MSDHIKLLAIDPHNCGCTECLIGEYVPASQATDEQIQMLMLGEIRDNTSDVWTISQRFDGGFHISATGGSWNVETIAWPPPVDMCNIEFSTNVINQIARGDSILENNGYFYS
ncbi:hypothetical protein [Aeromicrobium sp. 179-A 4D2 NHS]|uniref:hypothetical protein n=1 Tax=Aeromicrobium sp. 179-A 4D2 NHS TaxID=3142375 RepID=UPI0039A22EFD